ncbi:MAG: hypothetical protein C0490_10965 [Marivirga sp.]|nr:hypothetical protein [Marivirga sp.]
MLTKIKIDQVRLLQLFSSPDYFASMRDNWQKMVEHVESCLNVYMSNLPHNYRSKPLPEQPDVVWGHRVLPNFRHTLNGLNYGFILLTHGDTSGLGYAHSVRSDFKGQMDFWSGWMGSDNEKTYEDELYSTLLIAKNICFTESADWPELSPHQYPKELEIINQYRPQFFRINREIHIKSGDKVVTSGIYIPDIDYGCPQFLGTHLKSAPLTSIIINVQELFNPETGEKYDEQKTYKDVPCTWYLVETFEANPTTKHSDEKIDPQLIRILGGEICPQTGFYFTPAAPDSRKHFAQGEIMPSIFSDYGKTIWQLEGKEDED